MLRPFPGTKLTEEQRIYNYRHSRARRTIENTFGIMTSRWRIFSTPIRASVEHVECYVLACIALHNYLRLTNNAVYTPIGFIDCENPDGTVKPGNWRTERIATNGGIHDLRPRHGGRAAVECIEMRDDIKDYLNSEEGSVEWQLRYVRRTSEHY